MTTPIQQTPLFKQIVEELEEDISRYVDDYDSVESWEEICLDCPSDDLTPLLHQIPEGEMDEWYDLIGEEVSKIGDKTREGFTEYNDEDE